MNEKIVKTLDLYFLVKKQQEDYNKLFMSELKNDYEKINQSFIIKQKEQQHYTRNNTVVNEEALSHESVSTKINERHMNTSVIYKKEQQQCNSDNFIKKIYRLLSKQIHPDKNHKMSHLFIKCKKAYDNKNISHLVYCAEKCDIEIKIPLSVHEQIELELHKINQKINNLKCTVSWKWAQSSQIEKDNILKIIKDSVS